MALDGHRNFPVGPDVKLPYAECRLATLGTTGVV